MDSFIFNRKCAKCANLGNYKSNTGVRRVIWRWTYRKKMTKPIKVITILAWLSVSVIVLSFLTPLDKIVLSGVTSGYEGALRRLLNLVLISLLLSILSAVLGLKIFLSKSVPQKPISLLPLTFGPLISLLAFIAILIFYPRQ
jgi:hypothetical protein